jgi:hypothetical protein
MQSAFGRQWAGITTTRSQQIISSSYISHSTNRLNLIFLHTNVANRSICKCQGYITTHAFSSKIVPAHIARCINHAWTSRILNFSILGFASSPQSHLETSNQTKWNRSEHYVSKGQKHAMLVHAEGGETC